MNRPGFNDCLKFNKTNNLKFIWAKYAATFLGKTYESPTISIRNETDMVGQTIRC